MSINDIFYTVIASIALGVAVGIMIANLIEIIKDFKNNL
jgi:hypothetical protein